MAGVRDPAFWKRFSYAVHLDEENAQRGDIKHRYTHAVSLPSCQIPTNAPQRILARPPTIQKEPPHPHLLALLDRARHRHRRRRHRRHLAAEQRDAGRLWQDIAGEGGGERERECGECQCDGDGAGGWVGWPVGAAERECDAPACWVSAVTCGRGQGD